MIWEILTFLAVQASDLKKHALDSREEVHKLQVQYCPDLGQTVQLMQQNPIIAPLILETRNKDCEAVRKFITPKEIPAEPAAK